MFDEELREIVRDIAMTLFAAEPHPLPAEEARFDAHALCAQVALSGAFRGKLCATFSEPLARTLASSMMAQPSEASSIDDLRDVTGELVNIAAGNLKAVLPGPCELSLPTVQVSATASAEGVAPLVVASFELFGEPLSIALFES